MYTIRDLFDRRSVFSSKLEQFMISQSISKTKLCKDAHISRPTLDKLLNADITNAANFEKHVSKILNALHITPDKLMGNASNTHNQIKKIKKALKISDASISSSTGISISRLKEIEAGASATTAELRDIALCCRTTTHGLLGKNFFNIDISEYDCYIDKSNEELSGFWGHIGILTASSEKYLWYPISHNVKKHVYHIWDQQFLVIPCMNNKVLLLNMSGINNIIFLDDDCDLMPYADWDSPINPEIIPPVVPEALEDYAYTCDFSEVDPAALSPRFYDFLKRFIDQKKWSDADIEQIIHEITIHFKNQKGVPFMGDFYVHQTLTDAIQLVYDYGELDSDNKIIYFADTSGAETIVNLDNISMIEAPLAAIENIICQELEHDGFFQD